MIHWTTTETLGDGGVGVQEDNSIIGYYYSLGEELAYRYEAVSFFTDGTDDKFVSETFRTIKAAKAWLTRRAKNKKFVHLVKIGPS